MLDWLFPVQAERRLLPGGRLKGPTSYVIAIMSFAIVIVGAAGLALSNAAGVVAGGIQNRYVVQLADPGGLRPAVQAISAIPGVERVEPVGEAEMRETLERWLGSAGAADDLPVPALINFDIARGADPAAISARIEGRLRGAHVSAHDQALGPLLSSLRTLQWLALALVLLMAAAAAAAVVLAARGALDTHRSTVEVMHGIGATDVQVTRLFQRKIALDALAGSIIGGFAAGLVLLLVVGSRAALARDLTGTAPVGAIEAAVLILLPLLLVFLATWVARMAVLTALRQAP